MLPGFRFLFAAIVLSISLMVFGLGAASLLRAAHEEFVSTPSWRGAPESMFAQQTDYQRPVLAVLSVETKPAEPKPPDEPPASAATVAATVPAPVEQTAVVPEPAEANRTAALKLDESPLTEPVQPAETPVQIETPAVKTAGAAAADSAGIATTESVALAAQGGIPEKPQAAPASESAPAKQAASAASEPIAVPLVAPTPADAATKIATVDDPAMIIEPPQPAKTESTRPHSPSFGKRLQVRRAVQRKRVAQRTRNAPPAPQQPASPPVSLGVPFGGG